MKQFKYFIPSFIIMIIIFLFSNADGNQSGGMSLKILELIHTVFSFINNTEILHTLIRKFAHMSEYAILCGSFIYGFSKNKFNTKEICFYSLICTFIYACSDELHQLFIDGRSGNFLDVLIDTFGGLIMIIIYKWRNKNGI